MPRHGRSRPANPVATDRGSTANAPATPAGTTGGINAAAIKGKTIAGVVSTVNDPFYQTIMCGATKRAKALGMKMVWKGSNGYDTASAQQNYQAATLLKPAGMIIAPYDLGTFSNQVKGQMAKGVPVVSVDGKITPSTQLLTITSQTDNTAFTKLVAQTVGKSGTIGVLGGQQGAQWAIQRWQPLKKVVPAGVKVLTPQYSDFDRNKATQVASSMILAHPDLKAIYSVSGPEGEGAAAAVRQAGKVGKIAVFSYEATPPSVTALKSGAITALLSQAADTFGQNAVSQLATSLSNKPAGGYQPLKQPEQDLPLMVLTKANIDTPAAQPYQYHTGCAG